MDIRKPIKRARMLFSDAVKSGDHDRTSNEVYNREDTKYPRSVDLKKVTTKYNPQTNKKISTIDMGNYVEVSLKHLVIGGNQSCLKKICSGGSDLKIDCAWPQFRGHHIDAIDRFEDSINWTYHTRHDDQIAKATYFIFDKIEDATKFVSLKLDYGNKQIDLYQTVKPEEDITIINVPNYRDVGILSMIKIIKEQIEPMATIFDIFRKGRNKIGFVFKSSETRIPELPAQLSADPVELNEKIKSKINKPDDSKDNRATNSSSIDDVVAPATNTETMLRGTVGLKKPPAGAISQIKPSHHPIIDGVSKHDTLYDVNKQNGDNINKNEVNFDENLNFSSSEVPSSPINIKKEMLSPKSCGNESSGGFNTPSAHDIMAENVRLGQISTQKFLDYA
ncbi:hypothetical protein AYI69_g7264 [Smittium culicis]|uniref:Uncharacterized protein n=1 Tax=Smittium culicis TaxID=133412 RepID=A0A1R1XT95_9FUNG|nr:hypothetical protein AYI69_g7264 [Smittium culicis]